MNTQTISINRLSSAIPSQDLVAARDLIHDCEAALQCAFMASASLAAEDVSALRYILNLTQENLSSVQELLGGQQ